MAAFLKVLFLGVLQGLTEFLPVSSSGHLVLAKELVGLKTPSAILEISLHAGTLVSVLIFYRETIMRLIREFFSGEGGGRRYVIHIIVASIPAAVAYALFKNRIIGCFENTRAVAVMICVTGLILLSLLFAKRDERELSAARAFLVGVAQAFALLPGISRSGSTIVMGRHLGLAPGKAVEFSLLISLPAMIGATLIDLVKMHSVEMGDLTAASLAVGVLTAGVVGYAAISLLVRMLSAGRLWIFGVYCLAAGTAAICFAL
jgi:undecaprenyl-diphosphatase